MRGASEPLLLGVLLAAGFVAFTVGDKTEPEPPEEEQTEPQKIDFEVAASQAVRNTTRELTQTYCTA